MKTLLTLIVSLLLVSPVSAQRSKPDIEKDNLKGPVKAVRIELVILDDKGNPNEHGRWLSRLTSYNSKGNKTEDETFYAYGRISYGKLIYTYDADGNLIEEANHINGSVIRTGYTHNGQPALKDNVAWGRNLKYDEEGKLKEIVRTDRSGSIRNRQVFLYNDAKQMIGWELYDEKGSLKSEYSITYNEQGQVMTEADGKDPKAKYYRKVIYIYDDKGNTIKEQEFNNEGLRQEAGYSYEEFDSFGNWVKRTATYKRIKEAARSEETYRTITYYKAQR